MTRMIPTVQQTLVSLSFSGLKSIYQLVPDFWVSSFIQKMVGRGSKIQNQKAMKILFSFPILLT